MTLPLLDATPLKPVRCRNERCGRRLTDPESIAAGYGRCCAEALGLIPPRRPRLSVVRVEAADTDPTLFDLDDEECE